MGKLGFDNAKYLEEQSSYIIDRSRLFDNKLYLEFGGKLIYDFHAARILPGFHPNAKIRLLERLKDDAEILICVYAGDIERRKTRADFGITYDVDVLRLIDDLRSRDILVSSVVVTRYEEQPSADTFIRRLEQHDIRVYRHRAIRGYPVDVERIVSENGYGANDYIETVRPIVVVTAPGPGSGKMATCLSQVYHDHQRGVQAGYAKFETFPIWNLPLKHPVNVAYEAATADIGDFNQFDPFHLEAYGETAVNYNRDVEVFPVVKHILRRIMGDEHVYKSPTDMGVNRAGFAICDDDVVREASVQEVIRRFFRYQCEYKMGLTEAATVDRVKVLMDELDCHEAGRTVVTPAREAASKACEQGVGHDGIFCGAAIELADGSLVTGKNSALLHAASACVLNAVKILAGIPDPIHLLSAQVLQSVGTMKSDILRSGEVSLNLDETLIALSVSAASNPTAQAALECIQRLQGCDMHMTHMPTPGDEAGLRRLGVNLTCDPNFSSKFLHAV
ncbi:MAG: DUF1846 domain-containing protein [Lentisphaerae bacterium]|jgi:uncharacterized protein (UPF0371 family)|nr:DUF1846 domain-containing protein [Lentisphaerota bacterium]MBT4818306.1 DUF1846 domain-containing protein [Lentisphaerota bacterium]MBT5610433.1 DUF1846 domain-containing protein [Lentisphaerota bacterium]MBT7061024.1 DUF1846 domain-containing protein [Lentisphaerota bacterium]MBT7842191.1 DUF1846 domain-containing protein [Lentisphaerota bacterium]